MLSFSFKIISRKQTSIINQKFTCKYKSNESDAEASTHYWTVWLSSKYVCFYAFTSNKSFNFFRNMFKSKTFKINNFNISTIQSNQMSSNISMIIKVYYICPILYCLRKTISRINSIKFRFIFMIFLNLKVC